MYKSLLGGIALSIFIILTPFFVGAQPNDQEPVVTPPGPPAQTGDIVRCGGEGEAMCTACHFYALISKALLVLVSLITLVIILVIIWSGIQITVSAGDMSAISAAKSRLTNAIVGFAIIMTAWLMIDGVMRALTKDNVFGRPWNTISVEKCAKPANTVPISGGGNPGGNNGTPTSTASCAGATCVPLPTGIPKKPGIACGTNCRIHQELGANLLAMVNDPSGWQLTESWPPSGYSPSDPSGFHRALCHGDATCVDVGFVDRDYSDPERIRAFVQSAQRRGLTAVFETPSADRYAAYRRLGVRVIHVPHATADHFSVYSCSHGLAQNANACRP